jgi:hypothetical protein
LCLCSDGGNIDLPNWLVGAFDYGWPVITSILRLRTYSCDIHLSNWLVAAFHDVAGVVISLRSIEY